MTLDEYRNRHAQYKGDPNLQAAHASFPFIVTWDDHEVENNYAGLVSEDNDVPGDAPVPLAVFRRRRARAYRAFFEHMPLGSRTAVDGADARVFRRFRFGRWPSSAFSAPASSGPTNRAAGCSTSRRRPGTTSRSRADRSGTRRPR
jgi:phosphodiesterase/alkaline phosphatase D-like protein